MKLRWIILSGALLAIAWTLFFSVWMPVVEDHKKKPIYADSSLVDTIVFAPSYNLRETKIRRDTIKVKNDWRVINFSMDSAKIYVYVLRAR